jgi:hypothetical protein
MGLMSLLKRPGELPCSFYHVRRKTYLRGRKQDFASYHNLLAYDTAFSSLQENREYIFVVCKLPSQSARSV